ncbi:TetR family transcriptional regulator [Haloarchaeobius sp. DFWS5]
MASDDVPAEAKAEIAEAVRKALSKHGYAGLTTKRVAAESEKSEASLYYY